MAFFLEFKEQLKGFYSRFDVYIIPVLRFALAFITFTLINSNLGYMARINNSLIVVMAALLCSFLPLNILVVMAAMFCVMHIYALALECAVVVMVLFLLMFLLYFRFSPGDAVAVVLTPICFTLHIPFAVPLALGFVGTPLSAVSVGCGVVVHYVLRYIIVNSTVIGNIEAESTVQKFKFIIDNLISNREMVVVALAFAVTIVLVYIIRRLSVDYSWTIALVIGTITDAVIVLVGDVMLNLSVSIPAVIVGSIISAILVLILQLCVFSVDYSRTENLQFEDDEYYYYVKAVPKMAVPVAEKKVKKINSRPTAERERERSRAGVQTRAQAESVARPAARPAAAQSLASRPAPRAVMDGDVKVAPSRQRAQSASATPKMSPEPDGWRKINTDTKKI